MSWCTRTDRAEHPKPGHVIRNCVVSSVAQAFGCTSGAKHTLSGRSIGLESGGLFARMSTTSTRGDFCGEEVGPENFPRGMCHGISVEWCISLFFCCCYGILVDWEYIICAIALAWTGCVCCHDINVDFVYVACVSA